MPNDLVAASNSRRRPHIKLTGDRILFLVIIIGVGTGKAISSYLGQSTVPTTLEWLLGVLFAVLCSCLAWMERDADHPIAPWFFEVDYSTQIKTAGLYTGTIGGILVGQAVLSWKISSIAYDVLERTYPEMDENLKELLIVGFGVSITVFIIGFIVKVLLRYS
ncbi:hypothetical protein FA95DRAFT_1682090 [Auriscalpium vulgare]|uniref:Uncharacterized protein n=1 Tax=Auriscalpium vulgare TaxID=40419 RepID=A0ACB8RGA4_9AGAM|nr:hypothetical protein FA95DRAFT_1682090 [Auriscalpium vulgare]